MGEIIGAGIKTCRHWSDPTVLAAHNRARQCHGTSSVKVRTQHTGLRGGKAIRTADNIIMESMLPPLDLPAEYRKICIILRMARVFDIAAHPDSVFLRQNPKNVLLVFLGKSPVFLRSISPCILEESLPALH